MISHRIYFVFLFLLFSCQKQKQEIVNYRYEMRLFVQNISSYGRTLKPGFIIIPQNGHQLLSQNGEANGPPATEYINAIDGVGREDLYYGYENDDIATPAGETSAMNSFLSIARGNAKKVLVTDYCIKHSFIDRSYEQNNTQGYISFAADHRELDNIPFYPDKPFHGNTDTIYKLADAKNFLYIINPGAFTDKSFFISVLKETNYDVILIDLYFNEAPLHADDINALRKKQNGAPRKIICYMSIGEAEDYRYYWQPFWKGNPPKWMAAADPDWPGNYKVKYWNKEWQNIIYGNDNSYLKKIIDAGFDGVYLDIIDGFEFFEEKN